MSPACTFILAYTNILNARLVFQLNKNIISDKLISQGKQKWYLESSFSLSKRQLFSLKTLTNDTMSKTSNTVRPHSTLSLCPRKT